MSPDGSQIIDEGQLGADEALYVRPIDDQVETPVLQVLIGFNLGLTAVAPRRLAKNALHYVNRGGANPSFYRLCSTHTPG